MHAVRRGLAAVLVALLVPACVSVGPKTIPRDRVEYVQALRDSWKRQLLLNIVSLRYGEAPMFLEVASLINQYALEGDVNASLGWESGGTNRQGVGVGGHYADRPTITYTPVTGERYVRNMLTPVPPPSILAMVQAGWPVDFIFQLAVRSINGVSATGGLIGGQAQGDAFDDLLTRMRRLQLSGAIN